MLRDITMIFSVLISIFSVGFGLYKNIEAGNARGFAYEQAYRVMGAVEGANIPAGTKANILDAALASFATPPPPLDLERSSADQGSDTCLPIDRDACSGLAKDLAKANVACMQSSGASDECVRADGLKRDIIMRSCIACFSK